MMRNHVSLILQQAVRTIFGPTNRDVSAPSYMSGGFEIMGLAITYNRLWIIVFTLVVFFLLLAILRDRAVDGRAQDAVGQLTLRAFERHVGRWQAKER